MEIVIQPDALAATTLAAQQLAHLLRSRPRTVLGLATGSTPLGLYRQLIAARLDWSGVTTFNLDEYCGLGPNDPQSYHHFMRTELFEPVGLSPERTHIPDGLAADVPAHCAAFEAAIRAAGGIDLQVLGIGTDGHIGFNEPGSSLGSRTRIKTLTPRTRADNARFFPTPESVPRHVITQGIGTIMESRHIVLLAFGAQKAEAVAAAVEGAVSALNPASVLQMHPTVTVYLDQAAAEGLKRRDYYRWVYENKPDWQRTPGGSIDSGHATQGGVVQ